MTGKDDDRFTPDPEVVEAVRGRIIAWFREEGRDLPWRRTRDPWRVLVSEVMLQQIQVQRAVPFYGRFLERFPTVGVLAEASLAEAIRVWGDLGRYKRVVNLHRTARIVVRDFGGELPADVEVLRKLPGVGPYTAGAVACFAFGRDAAFFDTNMRRVLHRLFVGVDVPRPTAADREIRTLAEDLVPAGRGWEWNQGLMEFGALRCTARKPACDGCFLADVCRARAGIGAALAGLPRAKGTGYRYEDSNRYHRGRVLAQLRDAEDGIELRELGRRVRDGFRDEDLPWLRGVVESLERDGLAVVREGASAAETAAGAVSEERPPYGANGTAGPGRGTGGTRVGLP